jgi:hypothetical protein
MLPQFPSNRNLHNPYVINSYYYANSTYFDYKNSLLANVHLTMNLIAFLIGLSLTLVVLFLIGWRTPKSFQPYSRMLLLCAIVDVMYLGGDFWCQGVRLFEGDSDVKKARK